MLKNGLYEYEDKTIVFGGKIKVEVKETRKSITLRLIENTFRYSPPQIDLLFGGSEVVRISKRHPQHSINRDSNYGLGEEWFVIYPFHLGIPFLFELIK